MLTGKTQITKFLFFIEKADSKGFFSPLLNQLLFQTLISTFAPF